MKLILLLLGYCIINRILLIPFRGGTHLIFFGITESTALGRLVLFNLKKKLKHKYK